MKSISKIDLPQVKSIEVANNNTTLHEKQKAQAGSFISNNEKCFLERFAFYKTAFSPFLAFIMKIAIKLNHPQGWDL